MKLSSVLMDLSLVDIAAFIALVYTLNKLLSSKPTRHLPPGPKGLPIIGNIYDIPEKFEWVTYRELSRQYGEPGKLLSWTHLNISLGGSGIITLNLMGAPVIVINSREAAKDLLEGRSLIYADRSGFPIPILPCHLRDVVDQTFLC